MHFEPRHATRGLHLSDDQLLESYVLLSDHPHLNDCAQCRARFNELARSLDYMREDAIRDADRVFTGDVLHDQRERIMRRLERQGHPAEVLMFPTRSDQHAVRRVFGPARRWIAGAAAAGLAAGLFLGFAMDRRSTSRAATRMLQAPTVTEAIARARYVSDPRDEQILIEIEDALVGPRRVIELRALDVLTTPPELQEASLDIR
jgi:hypothetical protein